MASCTACTDDDPEQGSKAIQRQASGPHQQGYDYEFLPPLDSKYECSICLLCQREPTQTTCGHRFCKDCILTWIRTERQRCPEDNSPITEQDVFPDNFAKREILCLKARCPNSKNSCPAILEIGQMEEHQRTCNFQLVPCPNGCPMVLRQQDIDDHKAKECLHRLIECSLCYKKFPLNIQEAHFESCPMVSLPCPFCQANLPRQEHQLHMQQDCTKVVVRCPYSDIGCDFQVQRENLQEHLSGTTQRHLRLLCAAHGRLQGFVASLARLVDSVQSLESHGPACGSVVEAGFASHRPVAWSPDRDPNFNPLSLHASPSGVELDSPHRGAGQSSASPGGMLSAIPTTPDRSLLTSAEGLLRELFQRNTQLEQRHREQEIKMVTLRQRLAECETQVALMKECAANSDGQYCNGQYVWRLNGFSRLIQEARHGGHSRLVHSPGFYTGPFGYRVCLRLNVVAKDANGEFLSLFIHLMQGDHDDVLEWPFVGTITLTVIDQAEDCKRRQNICETMVTKPGLAAFQRPYSDRNPKGFGYTEFIDIDTLSKRNYISNDCLVIKAAIIVAQNEDKE